MRVLLRDAIRIAVVLGAAVPAACSFKAEFSASLKCNGFDCKFSSSALFFGGGEAQLVKPAPDSLEMPSNLADEKKVAPGSIVVSEDFVRRVTSVSVDGDTAHAETEDASLTQVIEQGETSTVVDLASDEEVRATWSTLSTKGEWTASGRFQYKDKTEFTTDSGGKVALDYDFSLQPKLDAALKFGGFSVQHAHAILAADLHASLHVVGSFGLAVNKTYTVVLWRSPQFKVKLPPIGPVPITFRSQLSLRAFINVDASGQVVVRTGFDLEATGQYGFTYDKGTGLQSAKKPWTTAGSSITTPVMTSATDLRVRATIRAELDGGIFGGWGWLSAGGGLRLYVDPYAEFTAKSGTWSARAAVNGGVDAYLDVLGWTVAEKSFPLFRNIIDEPVIGTWPTSGTPSPIVTPCGSATTSELPITCGNYAGCTKCKLAEACFKADDCSTGRCVGGVCAASKASVAAGGNCTADLECIEGVCTTEPRADATPGRVCRPLHCSNAPLAPDLGETDVDCGGAASGCRRCGLYGLCKVDQDCVDGLLCRPGKTKSWCAK